MTTNDIIQLLTQMTTDKQAMLDALCDGQALLSLGITDNDTDAVECAYSVITQAIKDRYSWLE